MAFGILHHARDFFRSGWQPQVFGRQCDIGESAIVRAGEPPIERGTGQTQVRQNLATRALRGELLRTRDERQNFLFGNCRVMRVGR